MIPFPKLSSVFAAALLALGLAAGSAQAQSAPTPRQVQSLIAQGQDQQALSDLQTILQTHPHSGVAWYLSAEANDATGNESAARTALDNAETYAPGLPFAKPADVTALQAHINNRSTPAPYARHRGFNPAFWIIGGFVVLFILLRIGLRRRAYGYRDGYRGGFPGGPGPGPYPPYGPNYGPGYGGGGGGMGSALMGGLAAGAGFAAGERVIDDVFGGQPGQNFAQDPNAGNTDYVPDRDDGLSGSPGWDNGSSPDDDNNFDPGNNW